jgi:hypothetical protein
MLKYGVHKFKAKTIFTAVKLFGASHFNQKYDTKPKAL